VERRVGDLPRINGLWHSSKWDALMEPVADATKIIKRKYEIWEKANRMAILIMLKTMTPSLRGSIPRSESAKEL